MDALIEASELAARLGDPECIVFDCRFDLTDPDAGAARYEYEHIPGSRYLNLDRDMARQPAPHEGRHPLPAPEDFARRLEALGVSNSSFVVVYDDGSGALAARAWWMLRWLGHDRVAVLNGGLAHWKQAALPLSSEPPSFEHGRFIPQTVNDAWVVQTASLSDRLEQGDLLLDARAAARFRGEKEPIDPVAGHIPGAVNYPFTNCLGSDGRFLPQQELRSALIGVLGGRDAQHVIAMCGSGVTACHVLLAIKAAGIGDGRLFVGSWSEWIRDPKRPIATGSDA